MTNSTSSLLFIHAIAIFLPAFCCGCESDWRGGTKPPFEMGGRVVGENPTLPAIEVIKPNGKGLIPAKPREPLNCTVRLVVPEGGALPTFLTASFKNVKGEIVESVFSLAPVKKRGDSYTLGHVVRVPRQVGKYRLMIDAVYSGESRPAVADSPAKWREHRASVTAAEVEVKAR